MTQPVPTGQINAADSAVPPGASLGDVLAPDVPWWRMLNRYHWFVFLVAALGWLFDCLDQQLFILTRPEAMRNLLPPGTPADVLKQYGVYATFFFLIGWATGGLFFGVMGDRVGRAKTMLVTILMYSICTGLSAMSQGFWDFATYRFLTGLGVGGEFAVGVALIAEVMPAKARPYTLAALQALSAVGNVTAALIFISFGLAESAGQKFLMSPWRIMFLIGALPALLALLIRRRLKEPERWQQAKRAQEGKKQLGSYSQLFGHPTWRKNALIGLALAFSGVVGLWAVGFFTPDLMQYVQRPRISQQVYQEQRDQASAAGDASSMAQFEALLVRSRQDPPPVGAVPAELKSAADKAEPFIRGKLTIMGGVTSIMINCGAFFGMFGFGYLAQRIGRKPTFAMAFIAAGLSTAAVFLFLKDFSQLFWMVPLMGFFQLSLFAGYAIYFPELFPTHLRSTGTSFCYNVGRFVAAFGGLMQAQLISMFAGSPGNLAGGGETLRYAGATMCLVFVVGLIALPFAPETKGQPLPEGEPTLAH
jgi:MFS family permease